MKIIWAHLAVMGRRMVFGVIITTICRSRAPENYELALAGSIYDPIETHVYCLGSLLFDCFVCETLGS